MKKPQTTPRAATTLTGLVFTNMLLTGCMSFFSGSEQEKTPEASQTDQTPKEKLPSTPQLKEEQILGESETSPSEVLIEGIGKLNPLQLAAGTTPPGNGQISNAELSKQLAAASASQREIASLQAKLTDLERTVANMKREITIVRRGLQSGLLDGLPADSAFESLEDLENAEKIKAQNALGFEERENENRVDGKTRNGANGTNFNSNENKISEEPYALLESASALIERQDYPAALVTLQSLKENYPNFNDEGLSDILLGESWLALKAPEKALLPLERFVGVYPTSPFLPRAKLAQANAFQRLGERQRSVSLLLEVISLSPTSKAADIARSRLTEIKEVR